MNAKKLIAVAVVVIFVALVGFFSPNCAQASLSFKVRLYGGLGYLSGGDLNSGLEGLMDAYKVAFMGAGSRADGKFEPAHFGPALGGDLILQLSPAIGLGLGTGYVQASKDSSIVIVNAGHTYTISGKPNLSAIPIKLSLFASVPAGPVTFNFHGGVGYYLSKLSYMLRIEAAGDSLEYDGQLETKGGFGFQGGIGLEFHIASAVNFFIEAQGRYLRIDGFEGTNTTKITGLPNYTTTGKLYDYDQLTAIGYYRWIIISAMDLTAIPAAKARLAVIDFSGGALVAGIVIKF
jgi:hypothetical protein